MPKIVNLIAQRFGYLEVIAKADRKDTGGKTMYICKCHLCGNQHFEVRGTNLTTGRATTCGCSKSIGETNIIKTLTENKITFAREYTFPGLKDKSTLRFDFAVMNENNKLKYLIEFDGIQHYGTTNGWNTKEYHEATKKRDEIKNQYCKENNIPLIRIPYWERDNITIEILTPNITPYLI